MNDLESKTRKEIQALCKEKGLKANSSTQELIKSLRNISSSSSSNTNVNIPPPSLPPQSLPRSSSPTRNNSGNQQSHESFITHNPPPLPPPTLNVASVNADSKMRQLILKDYKNGKVKTIEFNVESGELLSDVKSTIRSVFNIKSQENSTEQADFYLQRESTNEVIIISSSFLGKCDTVGAKPSLQYVLRKDAVDGLCFLPKSILYDMFALLSVGFLLNIVCGRDSSRLTAASNAMGNIFFSIWPIVLALPIKYWLISLILAFGYTYLMFATSSSLSLFKLLRHYILVNYWTSRHRRMRIELIARWKCLKDWKWKEFFSQNFLSEFPPVDLKDEAETLKVELSYENDEGVRWASMVIINPTEANVDHIKQGIRKIFNLKKGDDPDFNFSISSSKFFALNKELLNSPQIKSYGDFLINLAGKGSNKPSFKNYIQIYSGNSNYPLAFFASSILVCIINNFMNWKGVFTLLWHLACLLLLVLPLLTIVNCLVEISHLFYKNIKREHSLLFILFAFPELVFDFLAVLFGSSSSLFFSTNTILIIFISLYLSFQMGVSGGNIKDFVHNVAFVVLFFACRICLFQITEEGDKALMKFGYGKVKTIHFIFNMVIGILFTRGGLIFLFSIIVFSFFVTKVCPRVPALKAIVDKLKGRALNWIKYIGTAALGLFLK